MVWVANANACGTAAIVAFLPGVGPWCLTAPVADHTVLPTRPTPIGTVAGTPEKDNSSLLVIEEDCPGSQ